ncbi:MAG: hypothetical protein ACRDLF_05890 [Solirubrobacteraceae bacterium]
MLPVILIRHPLDRAFSVYCHLRRDSDGLHTGAVAQQASFSQFVLWCLNNKQLGGMVIANYQVIHLSEASFRNGHIYQAVATEDDLLHAIHYLSDATCFGTVDHFDAAMEKLRQAVAAFDLIIPAATVAENATPGRPEGLDERLYIAKQLLGPALYHRYLNENELDYRLYEWARSTTIRPKRGCCAAGSQALSSTTLRP